MKTQYLKKVFKKHLYFEIEKMWFEVKEIEKSWIQFSIENNEFLFMVWIQINKNHKEFCMEFGILPKKVNVFELEFNKAKYYDWILRRRIGCKDNETDKWRMYSHIDQTENQKINNIIESIVSTIKIDVLPVVDLFNNNPDIIEKFTPSDFEKTIVSRATFLDPSKTAEVYIRKESLFTNKLWIDNRFQYSNMGRLVFFLAMYRKSFDIKKAKQFAEICLLETNWKIYPKNDIDEILKV